MKKKKTIEYLDFDSDTQSMVEDLWIKQNEIISALNILLKHNILPNQPLKEEVKPIFDDLPDDAGISGDVD